MFKKKERKNLKLKIVVLMLFVCLFCTCLVWTNAYASKLQYEINSINNKITDSEHNVKNLEVRIKTASNITNLEDRALGLGLIFPTYDKIAYIREDSAENVRDLALALMERVYK